MNKFSALRTAIEAVTAEQAALELPIEEDIPEDLRYELMRLAGSVNDYIFWVRHRAQPDDIDDTPESQMFWAQEIESGTGAWGVNAREALDHYLNEDLTDRRRWSDHRGLDLNYPDEVQP
jgi:hypothetical protein